MQIEPLLNHALMTVDQEVSEFEKGIIIPKTGQRDGYTGTIVAWSPSKTWLMRHRDIDLIGKRILTSGYSGAMFRYDEWILVNVRLRDVLAIADTDAAIKITLGSKRCRYCRTKGGNMLLDGNDVCIVCGRNDKGEMHRKSRYNIGTKANPIWRESDVPIEITEDDIHFYNKLPEDYLPRGTIVSHAGQKHRGSRNHDVKTLRDWEREGSTGG